MLVFSAPVTTTDCLQRPLNVFGLTNRVRGEGNVLNRCMATYHKIELIILNVVHEVQFGEQTPALFVSSTGIGFF